MGDFWKLFIYLLSVLGAVIGVLYKLHTRRVDVLETNQKKVMKVIPTDALEHGLSVVLVNDCTKMREQCEHVIIADELKQTMLIIKKAIVMLVIHTDGIPQNDKEKIVKELI